MTIVTVAQRRAEEIAQRAAAVAAVKATLAGYAKSNGVRFVVFGSFARGDFDETSDLDLMIDGPPERLRQARDFAESVCERKRLRHDIHLAPDLSERLMSRIRRDGKAVQ